MAGLLGDSWEDPRTMAVLTGAAGLLGRGNLGQQLQAGLLGYQQSLGAAEDRSVQREYRAAQARSLASEEELRRQQIAQGQQRQNMLAGLLGMGGSGETSASAAPAVSGGTSGDPMRDYVANLSPEKVLALENSGLKGITEIWKELRPKVQIANGYAYDPARTQPGYLPQLSISNDGKATQVQIGPDGQPVVSAPRGAPEVFGTYQGIQAGIQAANTPQKVYNPATQREEIVPLSNVLGGRPGYGSESGLSRQVAPSTIAPEMDAYNRRELAQLQSDLNNPNLGPADRALLQQGIRDIQTQMGRGGQSSAPQSVGMAAGPSAPEAAANAANQTRQVNTAAADVVRDTDNRTKLKSANENLSNADRAVELLRLGPTGSGIGSMIDRGAAVFGQSTPGGNIAAQLDIVSANMVKNVPRFEGPQSNIDVEGYKAAAGRVADRSLPVDQRIAAAQEVKRYEQKAIAQAGGQQPSTTSATAMPGNFSREAIQAELARRRGLNGR